MYEDSAQKLVSDFCMKTWYQIFIYSEYINREKGLVQKLSYTTSLVIDVLRFGVFTGFSL